MINGKGRMIVEGKRMNKWIIQWQKSNITLMFDKGPEKKEISLSSIIPDALKSETICC